MATTTGALLSFGASGALAKTQVYSRWRGVPYVRKYVVPSNPKTSGQVETRSVFTWSSSVWKNASSQLQAVWTLVATGQQFYNRNAFMGRNVKALRPGTDLSAFIASPGAAGGLAPIAIAPSGGSGTLTCTFTMPTAPSGWTLAASVAVALINDDPHTSTSYTSLEATATTSPWTVTFTSPPAGAYQVCGWTKWTKPDGSTAYGASLNATATVT